MLKFKLLASRITMLMALLATMLTTAHGQQKGKASYYSKRANGATTSSGARLNNDSLVCAHRTHPFGTLLLVKNPANGKEVIVKVIDRGPHGRGRIIDLSYEAARQLGILSAGVAMVEVSVYDDTASPYQRKGYSMPELELELPAADYDHDVLRPAWRRAKEQQAANDSIAKKKKHTAPADAVAKKGATDVAAKKAASADVASKNKKH